MMVMKLNNNAGWLDDMEEIELWQHDMYYYVKKMHKSEQVPFPPSVKSNIEKWNCADFSLYGHFNRTFWEKVEKYEGDFEADLATLRKQQHTVFAECEQKEEISKFCRNFISNAENSRGLALKKQNARIC